MPIPNAMLNPLYGSSISPPVSSAPDVPSHSADDYRDPVNDTNDTYQNLLDSLTTDNGTLLGSVPDTAAAPAEMQQANYPTDPSDMIGDAYKNGAGRCPPAVDSDGGFHDKCVAAAPSPNFEQQMDAEVGLMALEWFGGLGKALSPLLGFVDPTVDARDCLNGDQSSCWWAAMGVFPFGRFGRVLRNIDDLGRGGGGALRYFQAPKSPPGIPGLTNARPKTPVQGGGGMRKRWTDQKGNIYEWDSQHGEVEKYNKRGQHLGVLDPDTGDMIKGSVNGRTVPR